MKNQLKKVVKNTIICSLLVFSSCEKDLYEDGIKDSSKDISVKNVSLSSLDKSTSSKISEKIVELKKLKSETNEQGKFQYNDALSIFIDTESGKLVNNDGKLYYTFPMFRKGEEKLENIIFVPLAGGQMETYFAKYNVTPKEFKDLPFEDIGNSLSLQLQKYAYSGANWVCVEAQTWLLVSNQGESSNALEPLYHYEWVTTNYYCTLANSGGGGGDEGSENTGNNPTGNNNGEHHTGGGISTTPILSVNQIPIKDFQEQLTLTQHQCFNSLPGPIQAEILNYIALTITANDDVIITSNPVHDFAEQIMSQMCSSSFPFTSINPFIIEKQIDDSHLDPCSKGILNQVKSLQQNDIAKIIAKLGSPSSVYKTKIIPDNTLPTDIYGTTDWSAPIGSTIIPPYDYTIKLNTPYMQHATKLSIASTIIHELIHAYFLSLVDDNYETGDNTLNEFPILWNYYVGNDGSGANIVQHNQMAQSFIKIIASALQEYNTGIALNGSEPDQIYKDLAWGGLGETPPYNALSPEDKSRIIAVNNAEAYNTPQNANGNVYTPISTPCN